MLAVLLHVFLLQSADSLVAIDVSGKILYTGTYPVHQHNHVSSILPKKASQIYFHQVSNTHLWEWVINGKKMFVDSAITGFKLLPRKMLGIRFFSAWYLAGYDGKLLSPQPYVQIEVQDNLILARKAGNLTICDKKFEIITKLFGEWAMLAPSGEVIVQQGNVFGMYTVAQNKWLIKPEFEKITPLQKGFFLCIKNKKYGVLGSRGQEVVPFIFDKIDTDSSGYFYASKITVKSIHENISHLKVIDETTGVYDTTGKLILPVEYSGIEYRKGIGFVVSKNEKVGLFDFFGKEIIPLKFSKIGNFSNGMAPAGKGFYMGAINTQGQWIIKPDYADIATINDSIWICRKSDSEIIFYPKKGVFAQKSYEELKPLELGFIRTLENGMYGLLNAKGQEVLSSQWTSVRVHEKEHIIVASKMFFYSIFYLNGNLKVYMNYPLTKFDRYVEGMALVVHHDKYGFIDKDGALLVSTQYDGARPFHNGLAAVQIRNKWGMIDKNERIVLSPNYDEISDFNGHVAAVKRASKWGFVDKSGVEILKPQYDEVWQAPFQNYYIRLKDKVGVVNSKGVETINPVYRDCEILNEQYVKVRPYTKYGIVTFSNIPKTTFEYDQIWYQPNAECYIFYKKSEWEVVR